MIYVICWLMSAVVGVLIGSAKGRPAAGAFWGFVLGPIGWALVALLPDDRPKCPECLCALVIGAKKCGHCGTSVTVPTSVADRLAPCETSPVPSMVWKVAIGVGVVIAGFYIFAACEYAWKQRRIEELRASPTFATNLASVSTEPSRGQVSLTTYNRLLPGMEYEIVCNIFGRAANDVSRTSRAGTKTCVWTTSKGAKVTVTFDDDRLVTKEQNGL
jgi:hypothetical protein